MCKISVSDVNCVRILSTGKISETYITSVEICSNNLIATKNTHKEINTNMRYGSAEV